MAETEDIKMSEILIPPRTPPRIEQLSLRQSPRGYLPARRLGKSSGIETLIQLCAILT
jgi:hypothetical protein